MTLLALYGFAALSLFGLAILTGYLFEHGRSAWRRWRCKQEMKRAEKERERLKPKPFVQGMTLGPGESAYIEIPIMRLTRDQLENLATARDKAERKIH